MKLKNIPIDLKKIPYNLALLLLTVGASLILGFLSFGGMYALMPVLSLAIATFGLSVAYEGEIYLQNIKGALGKLFKPNYLKNHLAKEYLLTKFPENTDDDDCPKFFKDYKAQLELLSAFGHKTLNKDSKKRKKQVEKTLSDMEKWFALQLFPNQDDATTESSEYAKQLQVWLAQHEQVEWQDRINKRRFNFHIVKAFSILAAAFMGLGSTYLMVEAFSVIPLFAAIPFAFWPIIIVPLAIVAGIAYGMLTYNAITDLINNNTVVKWYNKLRQDLSEGITIRNVFMTTTAVLLVGLAVALTICTAGTWWTVATNARPLFEWMKKMPSFIMGVINPIITGASAIFFNIQNTAESMEMVDEATRSKTNIFQRMYQSIVDGYAHLRETENWLQIFNPFRIALKLTITPLRILLFFGHLVSIALTSDRMPGIPQIVAALVAIISEGFEDAHYFVGHDDEHKQSEDHGHDHHDVQPLLKERLDASSGHDHNMDIPTWILKTLASPIYLLAALWDSQASKLNKANHPHKGLETQDDVGPYTEIKPETTKPQVISLSAAWDKQRGIAKEENVVLCSSEKRPSEEWQVEHTVALIEKHQKQHLKKATVGRDVADDKITALQTLKQKIRDPKTRDTWADTLRQEKDKSIYNQHRLFAFKDEKTDTQVFIEELPARVNLG